MIEMGYSHVYGAPPNELVGSVSGAVQLSPLHPGSRDLTDLVPHSIDSIVILAPPGTIERRNVLAQALQTLKPDGVLTVLAPKDKGGSRLAGDLKAFGVPFEESSKRHHRICVAQGVYDPAAVDVALAAGAPRFLDEIGLWSQPGVFAWEGIDAGSALLLEYLPSLAGRGADFGCGIGVLARSVLASGSVTELLLVDLDRRAIAMASRNITDPRAKLIWADVRNAQGLAHLDFVVMNPPFHEGGMDNQGLGKSFIQRAANALRPGGRCWLTANRHLPYEAVMTPLFRQVKPLADNGKYKIYEALK